ncbi:MAG: hypothetical protein LBG12_11350, partial [Synergistaceae bacterium]|nr:hypothetical protein [Synergistaceae bacterium]
IENIPHIYKSVTVDKYVIMPNHIHLILIIGDDHGCVMGDGHGRVIGDENGRAMRAPTISTVINHF